MQIFLKLENWIHSNPRQAAQALDQATTLFKIFVAAEAVGAGYFYSSLPKKIIVIAGAVSTVTAFFLVYVSRWIAKVEDEQKKKAEGDTLKRLWIAQKEELAKVDGKGYTPLHHAVVDAPIEKIQSLLEQGANIHAKVEEKDETPEGTSGNTPLHFAARHGRLDVVTLLLDKGCHVLEENVQKENSIDIAGNVGWKDIFDLLKQNANIEKEDSPLFYTIFDLAEYDQLEALKLHVRKGLDINTSDEDGFTLLHYAARRGKLETVKFLVSEAAKKGSKESS
jgi:hypothetical protein